MANVDHSKYNLTGKFADCWQTNDLQIWFNSENGDTNSILQNNNLLTYEVMWGDPTIIGIISFIDTQEMQKQIPLSIGGFVDIQFTSQEHTKIGEPAKFSKKFYITSVHTSEGDSRGTSKIVTCNLVDIDSQKLKSSYLSDSYDKMKPMDVFKEIFKKHEIIIEDFADAAEKVASIIIPNHINTYEFLSNELAYRGYKFIQDRLGSTLIHDTFLTTKKAVQVGEVFEYKPKLWWTRFQVIEYNIEGFNLEALEKSIPVSSNQINNENQNQEEMDVITKLSKPLGGIIGGIKATDRHNFSGKKQEVTYSKTDETTTKTLKDLQKMSIWVPGWNGNRLGKKVTVELPRPAEYNQSEDDPTYKGEWVVNRVRDKIINSYFIQELFLSRDGS